jgi:putative transposase
METPRRKRQRLAGFDYAQAGAYFITINTADRACLFGQVAGSQMSLNAPGQSVVECWRILPQSFSSIELDEFVVMPNHFHALVILGSQGAHSLPDVVRTFKSMSTRAVNRVRGTAGATLWHRSYYDHVVRNDLDLDRIRQYIADNPAKWDYDDNNPARRQA